jgi:Holliday junction DNA helicase RuvA
MIALLRGTIAATTPEHLVMDVRGVGYQVQAPGSLLLSLNVGEEMTLHISTVVREDAFLLYGFDSVEGRDTFNTLRGVHRIGTSNALAILSTLTLDALAAAVATDDVKALSGVPGIGKTTASRICMELKEKLAPRFAPTAGTPAAPGRNLRLVEPDPLPLALAQLDYKKSEIDLAMSSPDVPRMDLAPVEDRLRAALGVLSRPA